MRWKLDKWIVIAIVVCAIMIPILIYMSRVHFQPVQTAHVEIVNKRMTDKGYTPKHGHRYSYYVTFKFPDGSEDEFNVLSVHSYDPIQEGDIGTLSYKQIGDGTGFGEQRFISFEKDP